MSKDLSSIRKEYTKHSLDVAEVDQNPLRTFNQWFDEALASEVMEPNAMNLSTVSKSNMPAGRIVLLKEVDKGFVFYTNYQSDKGRELEDNPVAALTFFWPELERQVRIQGNVEKVSEEMSTEYFQSRPKESQIGAWTSPQSTVIKSRDILLDREKSIKEKHESDAVLPRPKQWGGYRLNPVHMEFWQGRPSRLHDRIAYTLVDGEWKINRLAP